MNIESRTVCSEIIFKHYLLLVGYILYFLLFMGIVIYALNTGLVSWPFHEAKSVLDLYQRVLTYFPIALFSLTSLLWLKAAGTPVLELFRWKSVNGLFWMGFGISAGYAVYLLSPEPYRFRGASCWAPVIILCILNAFSEEVVYRLVFLGLLKNVCRSFWKSNLIQSLIYALPHIQIVGLKTAVYSFLYGLLMGWILEKNQSVLPCMICHFCVDIGMIGLPVCRIG